jgi:cellulose 1,4-beta-cellobiosidase
MSYKLAVASLLFALAKGQQIGTLAAEVHPTLTWQTCTKPGVCTTTTGKVVLDANWRWLHAVTGSNNCFTGNTWDASLCPDDVTCAANCALDGADYSGTYGVTTSGNSLRLNFVTTGSGKNIGSRLYLLADDNDYQLFHLNNQEFTFDVNVANLPCGLNGALYMVPMPKDGGKSQFPTNKAGAAYGTGYCDSQCPRDLKFISGQANSAGWIPSSNNANTGVGNFGSCCAEMDIWEANSVSTAFTPHPANPVTGNRCTGNACGGTYSTTRYAGNTDPDGCDFNSYRLGNTNFYGPGKTVDTTKVFTVVTQFLGTSTTMTEIKRFYVQNGVVIPNSQSTIAGITGNSITTAFCTAQKKVFGDTNEFSAHGGLGSMATAFTDGMVLVMSLWDDYAASMLWLDSTYPTDSTGLGTARGTCPTSSGVPATVEAQSPNAFVVYSNIRVGPINSTYTGTTSGGGGGTPTSSKGVASTTKKTSTSSAAATGGGGSGTQVEFGQCGGIGYTGPTKCASPFTCKFSNAYYSQCL